MSFSDFQEQLKAQSQTDLSKLESVISTLPEGEVFAQRLGDDRLRIYWSPGSAYQQENKTCHLDLYKDGRLEGEGDEFSKDEWQLVQRVFGVVYSDENRILLRSSFYRNLSRALRSFLGLEAVQFLGVVLPTRLHLPDEMKVEDMLVDYEREGFYRAAAVQGFVTGLGQLRYYDAFQIKKQLRRLNPDESFFVPEVFYVFSDGTMVDALSMYAHPLNLMVDSSLMIWTHPERQAETALPMQVDWKGKGYRAEQAIKELVAQLVAAVKEAGHQIYYREFTPTQMGPDDTPILPSRSIYKDSDVKVVHVSDLKFEQQGSRFRIHSDLNLSESSEKTLSQNGVCYSEAEDLLYIDTEDLLKVGYKALIPERLQPEFSLGQWQNLKAFTEDELARFVSGLKELDPSAVLEVVDLSKDQVELRVNVEHGKLDQVSVKWMVRIDDETSPIQLQFLQEPLRQLLEAVQSGVKGFSDLPPAKLVSSFRSRRKVELKLVRHSGIIFKLIELTEKSDAKTFEDIEGDLARFIETFVFEMDPTTKSLEKLVSPSISLLLKRVFETYSHLKDHKTFFGSPDTLYRVHLGPLLGEWILWFLQFMYEQHGSKLTQRFNFPQLNVVFDPESLSSTVGYSDIFMSMASSSLKMGVFVDGRKVESLTEKQLKASIVLPEVQGKINWFELHPEVFLEGRALKSEDLSRLLSQSLFEFEGQFYYIPKKSLPSLTWLQKFWDQLEATGGDKVQKDAEGNEKFVVRRSRTLELMVLAASGVEIKAGEEWDKLMAKFHRLEDKNVEPQNMSEELTNTLKPYQKEGVRWLQTLHDLQLGGLLGDDMGLGKTLQTIAFLQSLKATNRPHLIVVPTSLVYNWVSEFKKFAPEMAEKIHYFTPGVSDAQNAEGIVITTYGLMLRHQQYFMDQSWDVIVFDEIQMLKNIVSKRRKIASQLEANFKVGLSGTPMENHFGEFYSLIDLVVPGALGRYQDFNRDFDVRKGVSSYAIQHLRLKTKPLVLRREKQHLLKELPEKTESVVRIDFEPKQKELYRDIAASWNTQVQSKIETSGESHAQLQMLTALLKLRQVCSAPKLIEPNYPTNGPKLGLLHEVLQELIERQESVLIFTNFRKTLDLVGTMVESLGLKALKIHGGVNRTKREQVLKTFNETEGSQVLIMTLKTGGLGLNLTKANYVFHIEPWWNPAAEMQANDRVYRMGQEKAVTIYRYIMANSVEEKIQDLKQLKQDAFESLFAESATDLENETSFSTSRLTKDDFKYLLDLNEAPLQP